MRNVMRICYFGLLFCGLFAFGADAEAMNLGFVEAETALSSGLVPVDTLKFLRKMSESDDAASAAHASRLLGAYFRMQKNYSEAWRYIRAYESPSGYDRLPSGTAIEYLRCHLEAAHLLALEKDIAGALKLLNWAEAGPVIMTVRWRVSSMPKSCSISAKSNAPNSIWAR